MKRKMLVLLVIALMLVAVVVTAYAGPPEPASGTWSYWPVGEPTEVTVGCNTFTYMDDEGTFTGTFAGSETESGVLTAHCNNTWSYRGILTFTGEVDGQSGTLQMRTVGRSVDFWNWWDGTWVILSGTDGLESLRGAGTWYGPAGNLTYDGNFHFEP